MDLLQALPDMTIKTLDIIKVSDHISGGMG